MQSSPILRFAGCALALLWVPCAPVLGAVAEAENVQTTCGSDCHAEIDWNPMLTCDNGAVSDTFELLACMVATTSPGCGTYPIAQPLPEDPFGESGQGSNLQEVPSSGSGGCVVQHETGNYQVFFLPSPRAGLEIYKEDDSEIDRLRFSEDYPEITWIEVHVEREDLVAEIGEVVEPPSSGAITVWLNGWPVTVESIDHDTPGEVTMALVDAIERAGFSVVYDRPYIVVTRDKRSDIGLTRVRWESTDSAIVRSEVALEPQNRDDDLVEGSPLSF